MNKAPISAIADVIRGVSFSKDEGSSSPSKGRLPVIRAGSIQDSLLLDEGLIWVPEEKVKKSQKIRRDDIVMCTSSGSSSLVGKCAKAGVDFDGSFGAFCAGIRPNKDKVSASYLYHFLSSPAFRNWSSASSGANIKNIRISELGGFEIPLPPLEEQKRIAAILDKADAIRRKRQQAIQLADEFLRAVFLDMFGDPVTNPKGFEIKELSDFFIDSKNGTKCGPFGSALKKQEYTESGIPVWSMDNISLSGDFDCVPALWVSEEKFEELNSYSVLPGDVIISRAGTVGKMGVVRSHYEKSLISTNLIRVRFNECGLIPEYFVSLMTYCKGRVGRLKTGPDGAFTHMNTGILSSLTFPYPPVDLQERFMGKRRKVISILDSSLEYQHEGSFAFQAISRKAFSGTL